MDELEKGKLYLAIHREVARREKWCRVSYKVTVLAGGQEFDYECGQFAHMGLLCSHVLKVWFLKKMKNMLLRCVYTMCSL